MIPSPAHIDPFPKPMEHSHSRYFTLLRAHEIALYYVTELFHVHKYL